MKGCEFDLIEIKMFRRVEGETRLKHLRHLKVKRYLNEVEIVPKRQLSRFKVIEARKNLSGDF